MKTLSFRQMRRWGFSLALGVLATGCGTVDELVEDGTAAVSDALTPASGASDAVEGAGLHLGLAKFDKEAMEGFRCDSEPEVTYVEVCGAQLPATVKLEWTDCQLGHGPGPMGPPALAFDGGRPEGGPGRGMGGHCGMGPGANGGSGLGPHGPPPGGPADGGFSLFGLSMPHPGGRGGPGGNRERPGSSGLVEISNSYTAPDGCSAELTVAQEVSFQVTRASPGGNSFSVEGTTQSTLQQAPGALPSSKQTTVSVTRSVKDADGAVVRQMTLSGSVQVQFASGDGVAPVRTTSGSLTSTDQDGAVQQVTLSQVVQPPHHVCPSPTAGSLTRTDASGTAHTLVYGPECGQATLDGEATELRRSGRGCGGGPR